MGGNCAEEHVVETLLSQMGSVGSILAVMEPARERW